MQCAQAPCDMRVRDKRDNFKTSRIQNVEINFLILIVNIQRKVSNTIMPEVINIAEYSIITLIVASDCCFYHPTASTRKHIGVGFACIVGDGSLPSPVFCFI